MLPLSDCEEDDTEVGLPVDANSSRLLQGESQASNAPSTQSKGEITCSLPTIYPLRSKRRRFETVPSCSTSDVTKQPGPLAAAVKTPGVGDQEAFVEDGLAIDGVENQAGVAKEPIVIPLQKTADDQVLVPDSFQQQICQVSAKSTNVPALSQEIPVVEETAELAQDEQGIGSPQEVSLHRLLWYPTLFAGFLLTMVVSSNRSDFCAQHGEVHLCEWKFIKQPA